MRRRAFCKRQSGSYFSLAESKKVTLHLWADLGQFVRLSSCSYMESALLFGPARSLIPRACSPCVLWYQDETSPPYVCVHKAFKVQKKEFRIGEVLTESFNNLTISPASNLEHLAWQLLVQAILPHFFILRCLISLDTSRDEKEKKEEDSALAQPFLLLLDLFPHLPI